MWMVALDLRHLFIYFVVDLSRNLNFCLTQINYRVDHAVKKEIDLYYILLKIKIF